MESDQFATYVTFTIQNVPIKSKTTKDILNKIIVRFTIQNVPIK